MYLGRISAILGVTTGLVSLQLAPLANADNVIFDDQIIVGSQCVGQDCVNGESFGFDTLRLKENNLRIKFDDTSVSSSFPRNDWQLTANDSANGGANKFSIDDISNNRTPFTVIAGAPSHSLFVSSGGRIGLRTSTPVVELHMVDGDSPTLRLEQDGSSGFTPQTWDVAGNETNFFVRDVTNGSKLPFKIRPSAPTDSLYVDTDGDIGLGKASPAAPLHLVETAALNGTQPHILVQNTNAASGIRRMLEFQNSGGSSFVLLNTSTGVKWSLVHQNSGAGDFLITNADGTNDFALDQAGNLTILGELTTAGSCSVGCDRVFSEGYEIAPIDSRAELMYAKGYLPNVGPTSESGPFNVSDKMGRMLNELEHAHIYIAQLNERLKKLEGMVAQQN